MKKEEKYKKIEKKFIKCSDLKKINILECKDKFISLNLINRKNLKIEYKKEDMKNYFNGEILVRKKVAHKIIKILDFLEKKYKNIGLLIVYGYRTNEIQNKYFRNFFTKIEKKYKEIKNKDKIFEITHRGVACPSVAGHPTGGAVDLTLYDLKTEKEFDMGTKIGNYDNKKVYTFSPEITKKQLHNRLFLQKIMKQENFAPYLGEWWHFSYGDKEWAKFYNKKRRYTNKWIIKKS